MKTLSVINERFSVLWNRIPEKKRRWASLLIAIVIFLIASEFLGINDGALDAYERGFNESCEGCSTEKHSFWVMFLSSIIGFIVIALPVYGILWATGQIFYKILFQFILYKVDRFSTITFALIVLSLYNAFYFGIEWIFEQNEAFADKGKAMKSTREYASMGISFMLLCYIIAYGFIKNAFKNKKEQALLLQEKAAAEIQALKAQINPHFLFNTLNNLYGTAIVEDSPKTAGGIEQLAGIMRHAVESSKNDRIDIEKEISFLHDYIEIQQMRLPNIANIVVSYTINWDENPAEIAPLILMTFIENAFKYGINTNENSFVEIALKIENQKLEFMCLNSIVTRTQVEYGTGTGIENTQKRLELIYPQKHELQILENENEFRVHLSIDLV